METESTQSYPDVSNFMVSTYMQDQEAANDGQDQDQQSQAGVVRSAIESVSDRVVAVSADIDEMFFNVGNRLNNVLTESNSILEQMSTLLSQQRQERVERETMLEEQSMLFKQGGKSNVVQFKKSVFELNGFLNKLNNNVRNIKVTSEQDGFLAAVGRMPKWVIGTLIGIGVVTAAQLGLPESDEEAGYTSSGGSDVTTGTVSTTDTNFDGKSLSELIAGGESGGNYNIYNYKISKGKYGKGIGNLEEMTINQVLAEQRKGKMFATGKYQIVPVTLEEAKVRMRLSGNEKYDAAMQERIFKEFLVGSKREKIRDYISGKSDDLEGALNQLSLEFSSVSKQYGRLKTAGGKGDKASISREKAAETLKYEREMYRKRQQQMLSEKDPEQKLQQQEAKVKAELEQKSVSIGENLDIQSQQARQTRLTQTSNMVNVISSKATSKQAASDSSTRPGLIPAINLRA
jgi:hypothetical protein